MFLFLSIGSVFRFGQEKTAGAVELLTYGPADGTAYFAASYIKDVFFSALALILIALFLAVMGVVDNLALGPLFFTVLPILFFLTLAVLAYGVLCSIISANASSALAVFLGILLVFLLVLTGALSIASDSVRTVSSVAAAMLQWISPFFYASLSVRAAQGRERRCGARGDWAHHRAGGGAAGRESPGDTPPRSPGMRRILAAVIMACLPLATSLADTPVRAEQPIWSVVAFNGSDYSPTFTIRSSDSIYLLAGVDNVLSARKTLVYWWPITSEWKTDTDALNVLSPARWSSPMAPEEWPPCRCRNTRTSMCVENTS